nr:retrovirus-related Pol polyprotein from transposon TNT 1-94 [Tanacetum cinerariifolium]
MPTKIELSLEQSQQGVSNDVLVAVSSSLRLLPKMHKSSLEPRRDQIINLNRTQLKMEILLEPTSNKLLVGDFKHGESNTSVLEDPTLSARNPVKEILRIYLITGLISCLVSAFMPASKRLPKPLTLKRLSVSSNTLKAMHLGLWYLKGNGIETIVYVDSDHARDYVDRKSTSDICTFVGYCLTSWFSKKQTALAISTTEAEYVSARKTCPQALWMKKLLSTTTFDSTTSRSCATIKARLTLAKTWCNILEPNISKFIITFFVIMSKDISQSKKYRPSTTLPTFL